MSQPQRPLRSPHRLLANSQIGILSKIPITIRATEFAGLGDHCNADAKHIAKLGRVRSPNDNEKEGGGAVMPY